MAIDKKKAAALNKLSDKGFDTEKKVMAIDIDVIDEEDLKKLVERMPDGVILSIDLEEVKLKNGQKTE